MRTSIVSLTNAIAVVSIILAASLGWLGCQSVGSPVPTDDQPGAAEVQPEESAREIAAADALEPFEADDGMGYRTRQGEVAISPRFMMAHPFDDHGKAAVYDDQGWAYIDAAGEVLVRAYEFDNGPDYFQEGLARYVDEGQVGYINERAEVVIDAQFDFATPFEDGRARVCRGCTPESDGPHSQYVGGTWWEIDREGNKAAPPADP